MKINWKERVKGDVERQIIKEADRNTKTEHERKREFYKKLYSKIKKYEFPPKDKININKHFFFPKSIITEYNLSKRALAVYPVMCLKADFKVDTWFHISLEEIVTKSGLSKNTVSKALLDLKDKGLLTREKRNAGKKHYYFYRVQFIRKDMIEEHSNQYFIFNQSIVDTGTWSDLNLRSKALYLAFRVMARFDIDTIFDKDEIQEAPWIDYDFYIKMNLAEHRYRDYDICTAPISLLCELVGINSSNIKPTIKQLEDYNLIKYYFYGCTEVYLRPKL